MENEIYTLDIPQREGKEGFVGMFFSTWLNMQAVLKSPEFSREPMRIYYMSQIMISMIPGEANREKIRNDLKKNLEEAREAYRKETNTNVIPENQSIHILIEATMKTLGSVSDFIDKHVGVSVENKVGFVRREH